MPRIDVTNLTALPDLSEFWAWSHAQVTGDISAGISAIRPDAMISRTLCPHKLDPDTLYNAFLVPAFEGGRLAGLGKDTMKIG